MPSSTKKPNAKTRKPAQAKVAKKAAKKVTAKVAAKVTKTAARPVKRTTAAAATGPRRAAKKRAAATAATTPPAPTATPVSAPASTPASAPRSAQAASRAMLGPITIEVTGRVIDDDARRGLPPVLEPGTSRGGAAPDPFLIEPRLTVVKAIDLRASARGVRSGDKPPPPQTLDIQPGQLLAVESDDGLVLFTSGARLQEIVAAKMPSASRGAVVSLDTLAEGTARRSGVDEATRGGLLDKLSAFATRILVLDVKDAADPVMDAAKAWLKEQGAAVPADAAEWGASVLGAKALSYVVERRLLQKPGLYHFAAEGDGADALKAVSRAALAEAAVMGPLLVFIHGTGSNTLGSFSGLRNDAFDWQALRRHYGDRIYGFEHHTFSASPIENAHQLLDELPAGARVHLVTHSRGGIVGDLLCVDWANRAEVDALVQRTKRIVSRNNEDAKDSFARADAEDRQRLQALAALSSARAARVERYVRVAAPVNGTLLMGRNVDLFLSVVLNLLQLAGTAAAGPLAAVPLQATKRIVADLVRHRCNANVVPGLEAMLPLSSTAAFLAQAPVVPGLALGIIAGDIEGTRLNLRRLVEFFTDWTFFDRHDHDLVVDTDSMDAGVARIGKAAGDGTVGVLFDQGPDVDHLSYFRRPKTRTALVSWLTAAKPADVSAFARLPDPKAAAEAREAQRKTLRAGTARDKPVLLLLPGVMGSYLHNPQERLWIGASEALRGCALQLAWPDAKGIAPRGLFDDFYGALCLHLEATHRVERFAYDWRLPIDDNAKLLRTQVDELLRTAGTQPLRFLAHSMGGLVVRAMAAQDEAFWNTLLARPGARVVMAGTPHQGSHAAVGMLIGRHDVLRKLAVLYNGNSLQEHVDLIATLPGAMQLMPRREFVDGVDVVGDYLDPATWQKLRTQPGQSPKIIDWFFGHGIVGVPTDAAVKKAKALFALPGFGRDEPCMPGDAAHADKIVMVLGRADDTPIGLKEDDGTIRLAYSGTGDGTVPWASSQIRGIGSAYRVDAEHGNLCADPRWFAAYADLLSTGRTTQAESEGWPEAVNRSGATGRPVPLVLANPSPESWPSEASLLRAAVGAGRRAPETTQRKLTAALGFDLKVACYAMDLRDAKAPLLVGHYEGDPIAGPQSTIDTDVLNGELSMRHHLGLYAGPIGTAAVVVQEPSQDQEQRGERRGAVVLGLGELGTLTANGVTRAVRAGCLRYLMASVDRRAGSRVGADAQPLKLTLASLLLGQNSTTNITIADSVGAIVRGVVEANLEFRRAREGALQAQIVELQFIEWYLDAAITATKALRDIAETITKDKGDYDGVRIIPDHQLRQSDSMRMRLEAQEASGYWPRLIVTGRVGKRPWRQAQDDADANGVDPLKAPVADSLQFVFLSQRARAEAEVLHRQPGLVEKLAQLSIDRPGGDLALGRTLFQLMTPLSFKDTARQIDALVLVVDGFTANFPWELMVADDTPMIERTRVVRQFETLTWRQQVRPVMQLTAYVVGDPSTKNFDKHFTQYGPMPRLRGAEDEALMVSKALTRSGFKVEQAIGESVEGIDVIHRLFKQSYRVLHIAAHGMFDLRPVGGGPDQARSGVVLSDGMFLTAAEVRQMEQVPDLVFLNCCHLGVMDDASQQPSNERHRLAASLSRELIDMGVRAVIAAGWPVDDRAATHFASVFYEHFLTRGRSFGDAVHEARRTTWRLYPATNTWGAYQAYGDPSFVLDPQRKGADTHRQQDPYAAPEEAASAFDLLSDALRRPSGRRRYDTLAKLDAAVQRVFDRCPEAWRDRGNLSVAAAAVYAQFGDEGFAKAIEHYLKGVGSPATDPRSYPSLRALEQLANFEARSHQSRNDEAGVERAAKRLETMVVALSKTPGATADEVPPPSPELCGLIGKCWKSLAVGRLAQEAAVAAGEAPKPKALKKGEPKPKTSGELLEKAKTWYRRGARSTSKVHTARFCMVNYLALAVLTGDTSVTDADLQALRSESLARYPEVSGEDRVYEGFIALDVDLLRTLQAGKLSDKKSFDELVQRFRDSRVALDASPKHWSSVTKQINSLATLTQAAACPPKVRAQRARLEAFAQEVKGV